MNAAALLCVFLIQVHLARGQDASREAKLRWVDAKEFCVEGKGWANEGEDF
jgi:hypothetical protein